MIVALPCKVDSARRAIRIPTEVVGSPRQRGQALLIALCLATVGAMAWLGLYSVAHTANARVRLTHTADAVAYSGAAAQARSLNLLAYINRAQVAHQVAMAHLVTFASWAEFGNTQSAQSKKGNTPAALMANFFDGAAATGYQQSRSMGNAVAELEKAFQEHDRLVHDVLHKASASIVNNMHAYRYQAMLQVLRANYPEYDKHSLVHDHPRSASRLGALRISILSDGAPDYVRMYSGQLNDHLRGQVEHAVNQYDFLHARDEIHHTEKAKNEQCPAMRNELRRHGSTHLDAEGHWSSQDTLSYHKVLKNQHAGCYFREYHLGWAQVGYTSTPSVSAGEAPPVNFSKQDFWSWVQEHTAWDISSGDGNPLAEGYATLEQQRWRGRGLPQYHELAEESTRQPLRFAIELHQAATSSATADGSRQFASPIGEYAHQVFNRGVAARVTSAAESYFSAPDDVGNESSVSPNLFNPYWRARLSAIQRADSTTQP